MMYKLLLSSLLLYSLNIEQKPPKITPDNRLFLDINGEFFQVYECTEDEIECGDCDFILSPFESDYDDFNWVELQEKK